MNAPNYNIKTLIVGKDLIWNDGFYAKSDEDFNDLVELFKAGVKLYVQGYGEFSEGEEPYYINDLVTRYEGVFETVSGYSIIRPLS